MERNAKCAKAHGMNWRNLMMTKTHYEAWLAAQYVAIKSLEKRL
jgi:hypothetical protein